MDQGFRLSARGHDSRHLGRPWRASLCAPVVPKRFRASSTRDERLQALAAAIAAWPEHPSGPRRPSRRRGRLRTRRWRDGGAPRSARRWPDPLRGEGRLADRANRSLRLLEPAGISSAVIATARPAQDVEEEIAVAPLRALGHAWPALIYAVPLLMSALPSRRDSTRRRSARRRRADRHCTRYGPGTRPRPEGRSASSPLLRAARLRDDAATAGSPWRHRILGCPSVGSRSVSIPTARDTTWSAAGTVECSKPDDAFEGSARSRRAQRRLQVKGDYLPRACEPHR